MGIAKYIQTMPRVGCNMCARHEGSAWLPTCVARKQARCMHEWFVLKGLYMITLALRHILTPIMQASHGLHPMEVVNGGVRKNEGARMCARQAIPPLSSAMAPRL